jgi:hypothetical protein
MVPLVSTSGGGNLLLEFNSCQMGSFMSVAYSASCFAYNSMHVVAQD